MPINRNESFFVLTNEGDGKGVSEKVGQQFAKLEMALELREEAPPERETEADIFASVELSKFLAGLAHAAAEYALKSKNYRSWKALGMAAAAAEDGVAAAEATDVWREFQAEQNAMKGGGP